MSKQESISHQGKRRTTHKRKDYKKELIATEEELNTLKDQYLRLLAEFDNYKKRRERDLANFIENANVTLIEELLPISDDFERSLNSKQDKKAIKSFYEGMKIIYQKFRAVLEKQGLKAIEAIGKPFDPALHEALMQIEKKEFPSNIVVEEAVKGYTLKDKVLRHSKVVVTK